MRVIFERPQRVPIHTWAERLDRDVLARLQRTARSRVLSAPVIVLPDVHPAGEVCVGTVLITDNVVFPTAIGEDLGCGMSAQAYPLSADDFTRNDWGSIVTTLQTTIPAGQHAHNRPSELPSELRNWTMSCRTLAHTRDWLSSRHLGTLGGGNHFAELQRAADGRVWVTVHSGSRGPGATIAQHHAHILQSGAGHKDASGLWFLDWDSPAGQSFRQDLEWAVLFARANRHAMLDVVTQVLEKYVGHDLRPEEALDVSHNLIESKTLQGRRAVVHRKGASPANTGVRGILPGSMGTSTYIVEGLGNPASWCSCAHGAGRRMPRAEARKRISVEQLRNEMAHVVCPRGDRLEAALVEEAPSAYRDIKEVLHEQTDLIRPVLRLEPRAVLKGS